MNGKRRLGALEAESPFQSAFEQPWAHPSRGSGDGSIRGRSESADEFESEDQFESEDEFESGGIR